VGRWLLGIANTERTRATLEALVVRPDRIDRCQSADQFVRRAAQIKTRYPERPSDIFLNGFGTVNAIHIEKAIFT
jgi:hypothetical protein